MPPGDRARVVPPGESHGDCWPPTGEGLGERDRSDGLGDRDRDRDRGGDGDRVGVQSDGVHGLCVNGRDVLAFELKINGLGGDQS